MKKILVLLFCFVIASSMTSCGLQKAIDQADKMSNRDSDNSKEVDSQDVETVSDKEAINYLNNDDHDDIISADDSSSDTFITTSISEDFTQFQSAMSNFITAYTNTKQPFSDSISSAPEYDNYIFDLLDFFMVDMSIVSVPLYDALDITGTGGNKITGELMLSGYEGTKEKDGNLIRFGYSHTFEEDWGANLAGDLTQESGYFDTTKNFLFLENTTESGSSLIQRSVLELSRLSDGTFILQSHSYDSRRAANGVSSTFMKFDTKSLTSYSASKDSNETFTFQTLEESGDLSLEDLSKGFTTNFVIDVENGTATFTSK